METKTLLQILEKNVNVPGLLIDILDKVVEPALDGFVKASPTPIDDALKAALYDQLVRAIKLEATKLWAKVDGQ